MGLREKSQIPDDVTTGKMTLISEANFCSISCDVEKLLEAIKYELSPRGSAENRLTHVLCAVLVPLNMTYVMPLLSSSKKDKIKGE